MAVGRDTGEVEEMAVGRGHRREAASVGAVGALERDGIKMRSCRCEGGRQKKEVGAPGRPKENGGRAYALPPFVMRGCALLRLPDQNTITARETRCLLLRLVPCLSLFIKSTHDAWLMKRGFWSPVDDQ